MAEELPGTAAFAEACQRVILYSNNDYAKAYAERGMSMTDREMIKVQALYILTNLTYWRGEQAKATKATLKLFSKYKGS